MVDVELLQIRLNYSSTIIAKFCLIINKDLFLEIESKIGKVKVEKAINFGSVSFSILCTTKDGKRIIIKIISSFLDNDERYYNYHIKMLKNEIFSLSLLKNSEILVPNLLIYGSNYYVVEYIEGMTYYECEDNDLKSKVKEQLKEEIIKIRSFKSDKGEFIDLSRMFSKYVDEGVSFPNNYEKSREICDWIPNGDNFVLSHNDLHGANIIVNDKGLAGIIDWELSGFYPEGYEESKYRKLGGNYELFLNEIL